MGKVKGKAAKNFAKKQSKFAAKNAAIASLFGPITITGQKKNRKIKFDPPKKQKKKQKSVTKSAKSSKSQKEDRSQKKKKTTFQLQLPSVTSALKAAAAVPWMSSRSEDKEKPSVSSTSNAKKRTRDQPRLPTDDIPEPLLAQLDRELEAFAKYVRLTEAECRSRTHLVEELETLAKSVFGERRHIRFNGQPPEDVRVQVFGSFATRAVCTFTSDVDLALWGVVPVPQTVIAVKKKPRSIPSEASKEKIAKKDRVKKWHEAIAAIDSENAMTPDHASTNNEDENLGAKSQLSSSSDPTQLFVIDRTSDPEMEPGLGSNEATSTLQKSKKRDLVTIGDSAETAIEVSSETEGSNESNSNVNADNESSSSQDTADKLESFPADAFVEKDSQDAEHVVSLSSSDSESDDDCGASGSDEKEMEVSFVAPAQVASPSRVSGPSGRTRLEVVDALGTLSRKLRKSSFSESVQLIKNARVPIIKMTTKLGFETDVAVGGHNGTDTSLYAATQAKKFKSFAAVVLALKVILEQQDLDKPFTGGLGSYKLYVMVAYHLQRHLTLGGSDRPSEILLSFLFRFGHVKGHNVDERTRTELDQDIPLIGDDGSSADLSNVFQLEQCVHLFQCCWARLWKCVRPVGMHDAHRSLLAGLVDSNQLHSERQKSMQKASTSLDKLKLNVNEKRQRRSQHNQDVAQNSEARFVSGDMTREQLVSGYNADSLEDLPVAKRARRS